jgi:DNA invertase Pin-like site-specific DNA recombinase
LESIRTGLVKPGSVLLCESLDRISRQNLDTARETARKILLAGVEIVTFLPELR